MSGPKEPFGYKYNEETNQREPISEQLEALEKAKYYLNRGCSMQSTRNWLVQKTGRIISVPGLLKAIRYGKTSKDSS